MNGIDQAERRCSFGAHGATGSANGAESLSSGPDAGPVEETVSKKRCMARFSSELVVDAGRQTTCGG